MARLATDVVGNRRRLRKSAAAAISQFRPCFRLRPRPVKSSEQWLRSDQGLDTILGMNSSEPRRVLFLCTGNSCRSQMAEGLLRELGGRQFVALSAGSKPAGYVHPMAVTAMAELGYDISDLASKSIDVFLPPNGTPPDLIISVCSSAEKECPNFPGATQRLHWPFDDPAHAEGTDEEKMVVFRRVRDEIRARLASYLADHGAA